MPRNTGGASFPESATSSSSLRPSTRARAVAGGAANIIATSSAGKLGHLIAGSRFLSVQGRTRTGSRGGNRGEDLDSKSRSGRNGTSSGPPSAGGKKKLKAIGSGGDQIGPYWKTIGGRWVVANSREFGRVAAGLTPGIETEGEEGSIRPDNDDSHYYLHDVSKEAATIIEALGRIATVLLQVPTNGDQGRPLTPIERRSTKGSAFTASSAGQSFSTDESKRTLFLRQRSSIDVAIQALNEVCSFTWNEDELVEYLVGEIGDEDFAALRAGSEVVLDPDIFKATVYALIWLWIKTYILSAAGFILDEWTSVADETADLFEAMMFNVHQTPFSLPPSVMWSLGQRMMPATHVNDMMVLLARPATLIHAVTPEVGLWHLILFLATREDERLPSNTRWRLPARSQNAYTATGVFFPAQTCSTHSKVLTAASDTSLMGGPVMSPEEVGAMLLIAEYRDREIPVPVHLLATLLSLQIPLHVLLELSHQNCKFDVSVDQGYRPPLAYHAAPNLIRNCIILAIMLGARAAIKSGLLDIVLLLLREVNADRDSYSKLSFVHFGDHLLGLAAQSLKLLPSRTASHMTPSAVPQLGGTDRVSVPAAATGRRSATSTYLSSDNRLTSFPESATSLARLRPTSQAPFSSLGDSSFRGTSNVKLDPYAPPTRADQLPRRKSAPSWVASAQQRAPGSRRSRTLNLPGVSPSSRVKVKDEDAKPSPDDTLARPQMGPSLTSMSPLGTTARGRGRPPIFRPPPPGSAILSPAESYLPDSGPPGEPGLDPKLKPGHPVGGRLTSLRNTRWSLPVVAGQSISIICDESAPMDQPGPGRPARDGKPTVTPITQMPGITYVCDAPVFLDGRSTSFMYILGTHIPIFQHVLGAILLGGRLDCSDADKPVQGVAFDFADGIAYHLTDEDFSSPACYSKCDQVKPYELRPDSAAVCYLAINESEISVGVQKSVRTRWSVTWPKKLGVIEDGTQVVSVRFFLLARPEKPWNVLGIYPNSLIMPAKEPHRAIRFHICMMPSGISHPRHTVSTEFPRELQNREGLKVLLDGTETTPFSQLPTSPTGEMHPVSFPKNTAAATAAALASARAGFGRRRTSVPPEEEEEESGRSVVRRTSSGGVAAHPYGSAARRAAVRRTLPGAASAARLFGRTATRVFDVTRQTVSGQEDFKQMTHLVPPSGGFPLKRGRGRPRKNFFVGVPSMALPSPGLVSPSSMRSIPSSSHLQPSAFPIPKPRPVAEILQQLRATRLLFALGMPEIGPIAAQFLSPSVQLGIFQLWDSLLREPLPEKAYDNELATYMTHQEAKIESTSPSSITDPDPGGTAAGPKQPPSLRRSRRRKDAVASWSGSPGSPGVSRAGQDAAVTITCPACARFPNFINLDSWQQDLSSPVSFATTVERVIDSLRGGLSAAGVHLGGPSTRLSTSTGFDSRLSSNALSVGGRSSRSGMGITAGSRTLRLWQTVPIRMDFGPPRRGYRFR